MSAVIDEKELRKAWLNRKFGSWEYHEELLKLHDEYLTALHQHWARADIQRQYPEDYKAMVSPVFFNFDKVQKPGEIARGVWRAGRESGWANAIPYNFSRGLDYAGAEIYAGMPQDKIDHLNELVGLMLVYCENITNTVDDRWEDDILDESYTGPIDWPSNWREEVARDLGINLNTPSTTRCETGKPCPHAGFWWTPAKQSSRRYFQQGETMPDFPNSGYGATIWMWDSNQ